MTGDRAPTPGTTVRSVAEWTAHWNARGSIEDPVAMNGYCVAGRPLDRDVYREAVIEPWLRRLDLAPEHDVLEVGCGNGMLLREIEARVRRAVGTDVSEAQLARYTGSAQTYHCAAHELPFQGEQFDRILMASVSHYFPSPDYLQEVLAALIALLRRPGLMLIADVLLGPQPPGSPYRSYDPTELIVMLEQFGVSFSIESQAPRKRAINRRYDIILGKDRLDSQG